MAPFRRNTRKDIDVLPISFNPVINNYTPIKYEMLMLLFLMVFGVNSANIRYQMPHGWLAFRWTCIKGFLDSLLSIISQGADMTPDLQLVSPCTVLYREINRDHRMPSSVSGSSEIHDSRV
jgi:hypothetical protein